MEEPGGLQSIGSRRVRHDCTTSLSTFHFPALEKEMATHSSVLAWRIPGTAEPSGLPSMRSHRVGHDWSDLAAAEAVSMESRLRTSVASLCAASLSPFPAKLWLESQSTSLSQSFTSILGLLFPLKSEISWLGLDIVRHDLPIFFKDITNWT